VRRTQDSDEAQLAELAGWGVSRAVIAIRHSIAKGWKSIHEPTGKQAPAAAEPDAHSRRRNLDEIRKKNVKPVEDRPDYQTQEMEVEHGNA
jgi:hypothetical protein